MVDKKVQSNIDSNSMSSPFSKGRRNKWIIIILALVGFKAMGLDKSKLKIPFSAIEIINKKYFRQLHYYPLGEEGESKLSSAYLEKGLLREKNKNILDITLMPIHNNMEVEFSSKNILLGEGYPNQGLDETNYLDVIKDFNNRATGIYRIIPELFLESTILNAEIFYDFPKTSFDFSSDEIINALSYSSLRHKEERTYGGETFLSRSGGFSLKVYDKEKECFDKYLGKKYQELNLNIQDTMRVEVRGKHDSKARGLAKKHFNNKKLKDLIGLDAQYSVILDYLNELKFPKERL
jgi:hypothetical protein